MSRNFKFYIMEVCVLTALLVTVNSWEKLTQLVNTKEILRLWYSVCFLLFLEKEYRYNSGQTENIMSAKTRIILISEERSQRHTPLSSSVGLRWSRWTLTGSLKSASRTTLVITHHQPGLKSAEKSPSYGNLGRIYSWTRFWSTFIKER